MVGLGLLVLEKRKVCESRGLSLIVFLLIVQLLIEKQLWVVELQRGLSFDLQIIIWVLEC